MKIAGICGSLRDGSFNARLLRLALDMADQAGATVKNVTISGIPLYNQDRDADDKPDSVVALIEAISAADGLLFATPEYNYSISGVLKNAIDWASRPAFDASLTHKPCGIISASMSAIGGARAQVHLRDILSGTLSPVYPAPDFLLASAHRMVDDRGNLTDSATRDRLSDYVRGYLQWVGYLVE